MLRCAPPHSVSSETPGVHQLTEDSFLFDGPRATYGRFRILHQIGAGSVGPVFRGEDSETRRPVVIKVIRVGLTPERVAVVGPALRALKDRLVEHPALCPLLETGVVDVEPFVVSPVIDGDSLDVALREYGPANMADAIPRLRAVADALDAAAAVDVAHGSLHLRDIIVSVDATVLTGIGVAAVLERVGVRPPVRRPYCAPEVALGRGISPAGDQYALAAIAHEWLSGRRVSPTDGIQVPTSSPEGAAALAAVFGKAMAPEPYDRYPSATAFVDGLAGVADAVTPRTRASRRRPAAAAPLLQFESADETPALTFGPPEPVAPPAPAAMAAPAPAPPVMSFAADDDLVGIDEFVAHDDDVVAATAITPASGDAVVHADNHHAMDFAAPEEFPLVTGPQDLGAHDTALDHRAAYDDVAAADTLSLPYADDGPDEPVAAADPEPETDDRRVPTWLLWTGAIAAGALIVVLGGRALLRWGTPGSPQASTASPAAAAATEAETPSPSAAPAAVPPATPAGARANVEPPQPAPEPVDESARAQAATPPPPPAASAPAPAPPATVTSAPAPVAPPATKATPPPARAAVAPARPAQKAAPVRPPAKAPARPAAKAAPARPTAKPALPAAAVQPGRLLVRSTPAGAEVFLNGERRGVSPVAIRDLALGAYVIRFQRAGFDPVEQRVVLEAARPARALEVTLARAGSAAPAAAAPGGAATATTGSLLVESRPSGARVFVDGVDAGRTPLTVPAVAVGSRAIRIELPGYLVVSTTARVEPAVRARVAVTLTAERPR